MPPLMQSGAALAQHEDDANPLGSILWNDVRVFLNCVEGGSFRKAAERLCINATTVARRIEAMEQALGYPLFNRLKEGLAVTPEAEPLIEPARAMERAYFDIQRKSVPAPAQRGTVRISITEGLGTYWVVPFLVDFASHNPNPIISLTCAVESADVLKLEADLSIQFARPDKAEQVLVRLGRLHNYPFASRRYAERYGLPTNKQEMLQHRIVDQVGKQLEHGAWARHLGLDDVDGVVGLRSNASSAVFYAVEKGAGIGALPSYACALGADLVPVDIGVHQPLDIYLTYHPDARKTKRVSQVIDWLKSIFDPVRFPWFRDEFIHPNDLVGMMPPDAERLSVRGSFAASPQVPVRTVGRS